MQMTVKQLRKELDKIASKHGGDDLLGVARGKLPDGRTVEIVIETVLIDGDEVVLGEES